jgi:iron complex transport system substrate-binding protein
VRVRTAYEAKRRGRRALRTGLAGLCALSLLALVSACSDPIGSGDAGETRPGGPWSFEDARGVEVRLDGPPRRIVADTYTAASLWDFGVRPVGIFGWGLELNSAWSNTLGNIDIDEVEIVGRGAELNLEALAGLAPDVIVGNGPVDPSDEGAQPLMWVPQKAMSEVEQIAPPLATRWFGITLEQAIKGHEDLAAALGADVDTEELRQAKEDYAEAERELAEVAANSDLRLMAVTAGPDGMWVANPPGFVILGYLEQLGFEVVVPDEPDGPWELLGWEQIDRYPADVILYVGENPLETGALDDKELWGELPAVDAGQVVPFNDKWPYSYVFYAEALADLAEAFSESEVVTSGG